MVVENTKSLLERIVELSRPGLDKTPINVVQDLIFDQLQNYFPDRSPEELHYELLSNGLFVPNELKELDKTIKQLHNQDVWRIVQEEYVRLKSLWNGNECPIFIFPLTIHRPVIDGIKANKNGVAYSEAVFLFVSPELTEMELKAMIAHEYHHFCRLNILNIVTEAIPLKDSLIIEGMAESMVEELYGRNWCSPWITKYTLEELKRKWKNSFVPVLNRNGLSQHQRFLYGDGTNRLPNWIGYCIGYAIVKTFLERNKNMEPQTLLRLSADEIISKSEFV